MTYKDRVTRERAGSALAVAAFHALLFYLFVTAFGVPIARQLASDLKLFDLHDDPLPPPATPPPTVKDRSHKARTPHPEGAASPKNLKDTPTPIVAPPPLIRIPVPPPLPVAPVAGDGNRPAAGASSVPGPGTGSGGIGTGTGSGLQGNGTGGGGGGIAVRARMISGDIHGRDYPKAAYEAGAGGTVYFRMTIGTNGRVTDCGITRSSGRADLDAVTCRIVLERFRFRPARDARGRKVPEVARGSQNWWVRDLEPIDERPPESEREGWN